MESPTEQRQYHLSKRAGIFLLIILGVLQLSDWAARFILLVSLQSIKDTFQLTDAQAGLLPSLVQFGIAILTVPAAMLADRLSRRKVIMAMSLIWSIFTLTTGFATQLWHLFISRFMVGAGEAGYQPAGQTWISVSFRKEIRSRVLSVFMMCQPLGMALGLFAGGMLLTATHDWRTAFIVFGIPSIIISFAILFLPDYKTVRQPGETVLSKAYLKDCGRLFKIKSYWLYIIASTFIFFLAFAGPSWVPTLLIRAYNINEATAGTMVAAVSLLMFMAPIGGVLADRWQKRSPVGRPLFAVVSISVLLATLLVSMLMVGAIPIEWWLGLYSVASLLNALVLPALLTLPHDFISVGLRSTAIGIQTLIAQLLGGMLGPVFVGAVSDALGGGAHGIQWGLICALPIGALSIIFILIMLPHYRFDSAQADDTAMAE